MARGVGDPGDLWLIPHNSDSVGAGYGNYFPNLETHALCSSFYQETDRHTGETARWKMSPPRALGENPFPITKQLPRVWKEAPLQSLARWRGASVLPGPSVRSQGRCHRALASALLWALGKHEVGKDRVRHTPRRKFLSGSLEKWIGNQRTLQKPRPAEAPGTPIPRRAPHSPLSLVRAAEPGSRASRRWRMPSGERDGASGLGPASSGGRGAGRAERLLSSVRGEAPGLTLLGRGGGEVEGGPVPPARLPASPPVPCVCQFPRERAPRRPGSDPQRAHGPGRRPAEAWLGTWCPWVASS